MLLTNSSLIVAYVVLFVVCLTKLNESTQNSFKFCLSQSDNRGLSQEVVKPEFVQGYKAIAKDQGSTLRCLLYYCQLEGYLYESRGVQKQDFTVKICIAIVIV